MARLFDEHILRRVQPLGGAWHFSTDPEDAGEKQGWQNGLPSYETVTVPSMWNNELGLLNYEGNGWYEKRFFTEGGTVRFVFEGVMTKADVWLDGMYLGEHYGGYSQFEFIVNDLCAGEHLLTVRADNRSDAQSIPQLTVDWFRYGGITREIRAEILKGISILSCHLHYTLSEDLSSATASASLELYNADSAERTAPLTVTVGSYGIFDGTVTLAAGERRTFETEKVSLANLSLWSCESPTLYPLTAKTDTDDLCDRVGFRLIEAKDGRILLNGKQIELRGVNRHEDHPEWGFAFPQKLMKRDADLLCKLGCNTVRGSHYPNSKEFVDMLDERGLLFYSEIPIWGGGFTEEALGDPVVVERGLNMLREMVHDYYNHPCVIIWGVHNEIVSDTQNAYEMTKLYTAYMKRVGGNRLVTHASNHPLVDICFEFDDVICLNMYYGWYGMTESGGAKDWVGFLERFRARREELGLNHVPVVMSEFGAAALYGNRDPFERVRWSEEYQSDLLERCLTLFHNDPMLCGFYIWQFCNIRTSLEAGISRARTFNNKGILDEYRNPKLAYFTVQGLYERFAREGEAYENS